MEEVVEDKKSFEPDLAQDGDSLPDPDEQLMLDQGGGRVWLVKVPRFLMERWAAINAEDVHLASIRVYHNTNPGAKPRILLFLPPHESNVNTKDPKWPTFDNTIGNITTDSEPDCYELEMVNDSVENQVVIAERPKDSSFGLSSSVQSGPPNPRARTTILTGRIKHDCSLRPQFSANYRKQIRERHKKYNTRVRQIRVMEDADVPGGRGSINRLSSGVGLGGSGAFSDLVKTKPKPTKGNFERMTRMPRNQLLDLLFQLFRETTRWAIKPLREKTQQPEVYLKEVLSEVAFLHRSGEHNGFWELKDNFKEDGIKGEDVVGISFDDVKMEEMEDDEDDDDDDMEEVS
ncbi:hypothetical protein E1B28_009188 [Marasmius oreades]|uniref:Transcription initiation factor IIF subunit beta n=1 Tax=Marasmius oreades TaxID=181124 RepID=A0A9P7RZY5_9AGAR|nr:uncharacterized protein E1B28_009188 [Marasmius oreades]KAG7092876.1 hypothetical protein E1B28_009188 [Marasmius oreades]